MAFRGHSLPRADQASRLSDPQRTSGQPAREELPAQARHGCALSRWINSSAWAWFRAILVRWWTAFSKKSEKVRARVKASARRCLSG